MALLSLGIVYQVVTFVLRSQPVIDALLPLFLLSGATVIACFCWRLSLAPALERAASTADVRAGLKNELQSALWFLGNDAGGNDVLPGHVTNRETAGNETEYGFIRSHLTRAANTTQLLDAHTLFPIVIPRHLLSAIGLLLFTGILAWAEPNIDSVIEDVRAASRTASNDTISLAQAPLSEAENRKTESAISELADSTWLKVENLARELTTGAQTSEVAQAIAARDAKTAARLLAGMQRKEVAQAATGKAARPESEQMSAALAEGIIDRLQSLLNQGGGWSPDSSATQDDDNTERLTEQVSRELREEMEDAQPSRRGEMSPEEEILNTALSAMSRESGGGGEAVRGESPQMQGAGRTSVGSGAMGRRINSSTGGAGDGEEPRGNPDGNADAKPVLGRKTTRLSVQLQSIKMEQMEPDDRDAADGSLESFYAATQAQAAKSEYEKVMAVQTGSIEQTSGKQRLPLAYRDAVKRYTLNQHRRDELQSAQERAAR